MKINIAKAKCCRNGKIIEKYLFFVGVLLKINVKEKTITEIERYNNNRKMFFVCVQELAEEGELKSMLPQKFDLKTRYTYLNN